MEKIKVSAAALCGALGTLFGQLGAMGPLLVVLLAGNFLDWFTGQSASIAEGTGLSSERGNIGIHKKVGYWVEVGLCLCVDALLVFVLPSMEIGGAVFNISTPIVAPVVTLWLCLNEALSIIENLGRMGVPVPSWLTKFITVLKSAADQQPPALPGIAADIGSALPKEACAHDSDATAARTHYETATGDDDSN